MIIKLTFKTPGVLDQVESFLSEEDKKIINKYVKYSEYITVKFDTDKGIAEVLNNDGM